jgi:hypothetical protein
VELKSVFASFLVMWFGLMIVVIIYFISTRNLPLSQVITICVKQSTDTDRESVPVIPEEVNMSDELNYIWCRECGRLVYYTPANTVIYFFVDYVWYTAAETHCPYCDYKQALFLIENLDWELEWAIENDLGFIEIDGIPPVHIRDSFARVYPEYPNYKDLTDEEEAEVLFFGYLLKNTDQKEWFNGQTDKDN